MIGTCGRRGGGGGGEASGSGPRVLGRGTPGARRRAAHGFDRVGVAPARLVRGTGRGFVGRLRAGSTGSFRSPEGIARVRGRARRVPRRRRARAAAALAAWRLVGCREQRRRGGARRPSGVGSGDVTRVTDVIDLPPARCCAHERLRASPGCCRRRWLRDEDVLRWDRSRGFPFLRGHPVASRLREASAASRLEKRTPPPGKRAPRTSSHQLKARSIRSGKKKNSSKKGTRQVSTFQHDRTARIHLVGKPSTTTRLHKVNC
jgi:hypothetical protein